MSTVAAPLPLWEQGIARLRAAVTALLCVAASVSLLATMATEHIVEAAILAAVPLAAGAWLLSRLLTAGVALAIAATPVALWIDNQLDAGPAFAAAAGLAGAALLAASLAELPAVARARARRTELVRRVAELSASGLPLPRILNGILAEMARDGLRGGSVCLIDEQEQLYIAAWEGTLDQSVLDSRLPVGQGIVGSVAATGRSVLIDDLDAPARGVHPANRNLGSNAQMRSMAVVPLRAAHQVIGVLEIDSSRPGRFTREDLAVLERIGEAISGAAQQAGPLEMANQLLARRVHELMLLEDTARTLAGSLDLDELLPALVVQVSQGLGVPYAAVVEVQGRVATVLASVREGEVDTSERIVDLPTLAVLGPRLAAAEPQTWSLLPDGDVSGLDAVGAGTVLSGVACVPVASGDDVHAVLLAATAENEGFDPAEMRLLQGIGHLAGLAIANARTYRRLQEAAATDALTGLLNRQEFDRRLALPHPERFAVLLVDVDRLKMINDSFGHEAGDAVLQAIAACLGNLVRAGAALARSGGDEFSVLLEDADIESAVALGEQMRRALYGVAVPFGLARISVGAAAGDAGAEGWVVRDQAGEALYRAKKRGRDRVEAAVAGGTREAHAPAQRIEQAVRDLLEHGGVESVYQPVVRLRDMMVVGYEALARPLGTPPDASVEALFAAAHRTGLMRDLDWLCRRAAVQNSHGLPEHTPLFINVGVSALLDPLHDVDQMLLVLRWARRLAREVVLEITEREVVSDLRRLEEVIATYRAQGFRFAIDDVGEGHSTLEVLAASNPEYIKVARSLTIASDRVGPRSAIHAVVAFAQSSGAAIIAEGIENQHHAEVMASMGVDLGQGWHLGKPMPAPGRPAQGRAVAPGVEVS
ncbi:MAG TPA: bifunctional diguanylate cyclase/phosphodiesterase [Candidatus Dormibacteraeota bacterium]|nr:bifunctional diguanylate cyclase/phosphodiesterase [Candidatus Dormibacteraeota bacterium]